MAREDVNGSAIIFRGDGLPGPTNVTRDAFFCFEKQPTASAIPQGLFDAEGWSLGETFTVSYRPDRMDKSFLGVIISTATRIDIVTHVGLGFYRTLARIQLDRSLGVNWEVESNSVLRVRYPLGTAVSGANLDYLFRPLDANGSPLSNEQTKVEHGPGWVSFKLPRARVDRVKSVEVLARPYAWVVFPKVRCPYY